MSRDYPFDRDGYNPFEQDYDSGYSSQNREYKDLYNPYKSTWERALKEKSHKQVDRGRHSYSDVPSSFGKERKLEFKGNQVSSSQTGNQNMDKKSSQNKEEIFDSGFDVTKRNTYNYRTTGFGPRD